MDDKIIMAIWVLAAYLIGGIPFGFIIGKMRGVDVRTVGSKNIGATNVYRTVGHKWGFLAFFFDFLKGLLPTLAAVLAIKNQCSWAPGFDPIYVGLACVIGHTLTPYMKFKGGKGVATAFGMLMALIPLLVLIAFAVFVVTVWLSHYISLGSCLAALFLAVTIWIPIPVVNPIDYQNPRWALLVVMTLLGLFVVIKHKSNIVRLAKGCENKIY